MTPHTKHHDPFDMLQRDLSLVLGDVPVYDGAAVTATVDGKAVPPGDAVAQVARRFRDSAAPAMVGLRGLSIEAARESVHLMELLRGCAFVDGGESDALPSHEPVLQTATLGHVLAAERVVTVNVDADHPVMRRIGDCVTNIETGPADLAGVVAMRQDGDALAGLKRVAVVIGAEVDRRVVSQWHRLAAAVQQRLRVAVVQLPGADSGNARGAAEVVTWQTGVSPIGGGVSFADGGPRKAGAFAALARRDAFDVVIDCDGSAEKVVNRAARIAIGANGARDNAAVRFVTPGLVSGIAARVMRFDGIVLWLCDDPAIAPADPTATLLRQLREAVMQGGG